MFTPDAAQALLLLLRSNMSSSPICQALLSSKIRLAAARSLCRCFAPMRAMQTSRKQSAVF